MGFISSVKKILCKSLGKYKDGAVRVNYYQISILLLMILFAVYIFIGLSIEFFNLLLVNPMEAIFNVAILIGFFVILGIAMALLAKFFSSSLCYSLFSFLSKDAIVCERMVQSEEVKKIFNEIIALDDEKKSEFLRGIDSVMRRLIP